VFLTKHTTHKKNKKSTSHVSEHATKKKKSKKNQVILTWQIISAVLLVGLLISVFTGNSEKTSGNVLSEDEVKAKMETFINNNLLQAGATATVQTIEKTPEGYKMEIDVNGQTITSYSSLDGENFFPQVINLKEYETLVQAQEEAGAQPAPTPEVVKADKPVVEVFVMSHCPYGTQIEKGLLPAASLLKDKADISIKFVNYAMHGEKEINEQLNQYCIQKEQNDVYWDYLKCFLEAGNGESCLTSTGVDVEAMNTCVESADQEFKVTELFEDPAKAQWKGQFPPFNIHNDENIAYGVRGSPTLVINGAQVSAGRDSVSLLNAICAGFNVAPEECNTELSAAAPSPGFGFNEANAANVQATCG